MNEKYGGDVKNKIGLFIALLQKHQKKILHLAEAVTVNFNSCWTSSFAEAAVL